MTHLQQKTAVVTGASRGFGRGVALALAHAGADVVALARSADALDALAEEARRQSAPGAITPLVADAADPEVAERTLAAHRPELLVLVAGAPPTMAPLTEQSWESFSTNWHVDVRQSFHWLQGALTLPLAPGSGVILFSSGAALQGSALSGGYAGAKATQTFLADYAAVASRERGLELRVHALHPTLSANTDLGRAAVAAYAERAGVSDEEFGKRLPPMLTPDAAGERVLELLGSDEHAGTVRLLVNGSGLEAIA
jgi:NAD(P)-dependent dehydrogenase (short-subunit alcohol dehydrogenase family)